jgi:anti-sigma factor RsiW
MLAVAGGATQQPAASSRLIASSMHGAVPADRRFLAPARLPADACRFISAHLRTALGHAFHADHVQWCLTVPAMWSEAAKAKMRRAACKAGLVEVPALRGGQLAAGQLAILPLTAAC